MSGDSYTEVTSQSWFSRIGDSIKGIVVGLVLFAAAFPLILWNENRAIDTARGLEEGAAAVVSIPPAPVDPQYDGKLVHINAEATTDAVLSDTDFGIKVSALKLQRIVEMYQWEETQESKTEKKLGGGTETTTTYHYQKVWSARPIDSSRFKQAGEHPNPGSFAYAGREWVAEPVMAGDYLLPGFLVERLDGYTPVNLAEQSLSLPGRTDITVAEPATAAPQVPATDGKPIEGGDGKPAPMAAAAQPVQPQKGYRVQGQEIFSGSPADPQIGDLRIRFAVVKPGPISLVARQVGSTFEPYHTQTDTSIALIQSGTASAHNMFKQAEAANSMLTWILRGVAFFMMFAGLSMVLRPLSVLGDVVPIIGDLLGMGTGLIAGVLALVLSLVTIAIAWFVVRPLLSVGLLAAGGAALFGLKKLRAKRAVAPAPAAT